MPMTSLSVCLGNASRSSIIITTTIIIISCHTHTHPQRHVIGLALLVGSKIEFCALLIGVSEVSVLFL